MSGTDDLMANADRYRAAFAAGGLPIPPATHVTVVACMDARLNPFGLLGLAEGDAHVIRNAGGVVTADVLRSLAISQRLLGTTEIMLIHHTDCGMLGFTDEEFVSAIEAEVGARPEWTVGTFTDLDADVRESIRRIRSDPFVPHKESVRGFVFDVATGALREVAA
jgi:carbonic anhydrase